MRARSQRHLNRNTRRQNPATNRGEPQSIRVTSTDRRGASKNQNCQRTRIRVGSGRTTLARYLLRIANKEGYSPRDVQQVSASIRKILGSRENAIRYRIATEAVKFNIFHD